MNHPQCPHSRHGATLRIQLSGVWRIGGERADTAPALEALTQSGISEVEFAPAPDLQWDTSLLVFLVHIEEYARAHHINVRKDSLPEGLHHLLNMAFAVPPKEGSDRAKAHLSFVERIGKFVLQIPGLTKDHVDFFGDFVLSMGRLARGAANLRARDLWAAMQECSLDSLPIISLTNLLFGLILAFVGAVQLTQFGAQIYVAGLVGIGVVRVMGAIMVGVVMAGRMGASYAALIGTMQVNEEVDALTTLGISPIDFLVLPRVLGLTLMIPFLTLYADLMGLIGGFIVGTTMLGLHPLEYINATTDMVPISHVFIGLAYSVTFGVIIALCGCYQGMRCGRSAAAVGQSTTAAVVTSIVGIIVATAIITILCNTLDI